MEKYERPGEKISILLTTKEYRDNYDRIFGKKESWLDRKEQEAKEKGLDPMIDGVILIPISKEEEGFLNDNCTD